VTLFPVGFGLAGGRSIGIRAFITRDFMTGRPACPGKDVPLECLDEMVAQICAIEGVARVALDITPKPPATTEWE
jgi:GMP synthase (glutamine-hydrolysing)